MNSGQERSCIFGISGCDAAPLLQVKKGVLHQMPGLIKILVVFAKHFTVFLRWNDWLHSLKFRLIDNRVGVVTTIRQKVLGAQAVNQCGCLSAIRCCTLCNNSPDRHTMRIHGQMQFCVEPPFVRLMA